MEGDFIVFPNKYVHTFIKATTATSTMDEVGLKGKERKKERKVKKNELKKYSSSEFHSKSPLFMYMLCLGTADTKYPRAGYSTNKLV